MPDRVDELQATYLFRRLADLESAASECRSLRLSDVLHDLAMFLGSAIPYSRPLDPGLLTAHGLPHALGMIRKLETVLEALSLKESLGRYGHFLAAASPLVHCIGTLLAEAPADHVGRRAASVDFVSFARTILGAPVEDETTAALRLLAATACVEDLSADLYEGWWLGERECRESVPMRGLALAILLCNAFDMGKERLAANVGEGLDPRRLLRLYGAAFLARTYLVSDVLLCAGDGDLRCELTISRGCQRQLRQASDLFEAMMLAWSRRLESLPNGPSVRLSWSVRVDAGKHNELTAAIIDEADLTAEPGPCAFRLYLLRSLKAFLETAGETDVPLDLQSALAMDWVRAAVIGEDEIEEEYARDRKVSADLGFRGALRSTSRARRAALSAILARTFILSRYDTISDAKIRDEIAAMILNKAEGVALPVRSKRGLATLAHEAIQHIPLESGCYESLGKLLLSLPATGERPELVTELLSRLQRSDPSDCLSGLSELATSAAALFASSDPQVATALSAALAHGASSRSVGARDAQITALARLVQCVELRPDLRGRAVQHMRELGGIPDLVLEMLHTNISPCDRKSLLANWRDLVDILQGNSLDDELETEIAARLAELAPNVRGLNKRDMEALSGLLAKYKPGSLKASYLRSALLGVEPEVQRRVHRAARGRLLQ